MRLYEISKPQYKMPNFNAEYEEALRYPQLQSLNMDQWLKLVKQGHKLNTNPEFIQHLSNTDANEPNSFNTLDPEKINRFKNSLENNTIEIPIVLLTDQGYNLLGGNTRLTGLVAKGIYPPVWVIEL